MKVFTRLVASAALFSVLSQPVLSAPDTVIARVDGAEITEGDVAAASASLGPEIAGIPAAQRRRQIVEFLITNQLMATAASKQKLDSGPAYDARIENYRRLALAETFYQKVILGGIPEAEVKKIYDKYVAGFESQAQIRARHILVASEPEARDIVERLGRGDDFAELAKEFSKGPSAEAGGDLGFFAKGDMVPSFDKVVFELKPKEISEPVQTQYGWHVIEVTEKRSSEPNAFENEKHRILAGLIEEKRQKVIEDLRGKSKIEILDPEIKKAMEAPAARGSFGQ